MAIKRKASDAEVGASPKKRATRLHPSPVADPAVGGTIVARRLTATVTPRTYAGKLRRSHVAEPTPSPARTRRPRDVSPESDEELNLGRPRSPPATVVETPSRTRSGKIIPRVSDTKSVRPKVRALGESEDSMDDIPTPPPSPSKRSTRSTAKASLATVSPVKPTLRKTSSPVKRRPPKPRTPTPVSESEEDIPEPVASFDRQASSSPVEVIPPAEESRPATPAAVEIFIPPASPNKLPFIPSQHCLNAQKRQILRTIHNPPDLVDEDEESTNHTALKQLGDLLQGTVVRGEGNSCLLLGPRSSGKTRVSSTLIILHFL